MARYNELFLFDFQSRPTDSNFYAPIQVGDVEYKPFRTGGRDGLIWRSQGVWLMVEAAPRILPGGFIEGELRRLLVAAGGFALDPETERLMPVGLVSAQYSDTEVLPEGIALIVSEAARRYAEINAQTQS